MFPDSWAEQGLERADTPPDHSHQSHWDADIQNESIDGRDKEMVQISSPEANTYLKVTWCTQTTGFDWSPHSDILP